MKKVFIASVFTLTVFAAHAQAYGEIGYVTMNAEAVISNTKVESSPTGVRAIFGYDVDPFMSVEAMAIFGASSDTLKLNGSTTQEVKVKLGNSLGVYIKPKYQLNNSTDIFARVGFVQIKGTASANGLGSVTDSDNGLSYGLGLGFKLNKSTSINADYMQYINKDSYSINGFTVGVGHKF